MVMTESTSQIHVDSSVIEEELLVQLLLAHIERSQLRWLRHLLWRLLDASVPLGGGPGEDTLEGLCLSAGLGMPQYPQKEGLDLVLVTPCTI